jgi:hypothetical protein
MDHMTGHVTETHPSLSHEWYPLVDLLRDSSEHWLRVKLVEEVSSVV